jgi:hypothetical protein
VRRPDGSVLTDPDWPGEHLLDTGTAARRRVLAAIVGRWLDRCAADGFQAVEPDNLDSWSRSRGQLTRAGNAAFARLARRGRRVRPASFFDAACAARGSRIAIVYRDRMVLPRGRRGHVDRAC